MCEGAQDPKGKEKEKKRDCGVTIPSVCDGGVCFSLSFSLSSELMCPLAVFLFVCFVFKFMEQWD